MEAVGVALGILGLAGSFKGCIDLFSYFSSAKSFDRDHAILTTKLDVEKALLLQWSQRVRLLQPDYDMRLDDDTTHSAVLAILSSVQRLLGEGASLQERYGLEREELAPVPIDETVSGPRMKTFTDDFRALTFRAGKRREGASLPKKFRWAIGDREKFQALIQDLSHFVLKLHQVVPELVPQARLGPSSLISMTRDDIRAIRQRGRLLLVRDATRDDHRVISDLAEERLVELARQLVLYHVWFRIIDDRRDNIAQPHYRTLQWALHPPHADSEWDDLSQWLASGSGAYWVSGKAGSGKSTLMKHLHNHPRTLDLLSVWARGCPLTIGYFFFWHLDTQEQKSQYGLARALLYYIVTADPPLIPTLLPRMWQEAYGGEVRDLKPPSDAELMFAFATLSHGLESMRHYCFFIDGLDEYSGKCQDGVAFIKNLYRSPRIKVVLSSRPIPPCVEAFSTMPKLRLQDLTGGDVANYVEDTLGSHPYMATLKAIDPSGAASILDGLANRASGVFLWIVLACRSIIDGFGSFDSVEELQARVQELPPELEDLFQHMLNQIDPRYHSQAAKILKVSYRHQVAARLKQNSEVAGMCTLSLAILEDGRMELHGTEFRRMAIEEMVTKCTILEGRLRSRCGGLLELYVPKAVNAGPFCLCPPTAHHSLVESTVLFMHRTVFEFLDMPDVWDLECLRIQDELFDADAALALMSLHQADLSLYARPLHSGHIHHFLDAIMYNKNADQSTDCAAMVFSRFEELTDLIRESNRRVACAVAPDSLLGRPLRGRLALLISVEAGMTYCFKADLMSQGETVADGERHSSFPFLFHAVERPLLTRLESLRGTLTIRRSAFSSEMIRYLLSQTCLPNKEFDAGERGTMTPWRCWLDKLQMTDVEEAALEEGDGILLADIAQTMEDFIAHGADLEVVKAGSNVVDMIILRYFHVVSRRTRHSKFRTQHSNRLRSLVQSIREAGIRKRRCEELDDESRPQRTRRRLAEEGEEK
ncbi:related to small s protein [Cephalotrichum gorgonifer]|uniref:Related to small s protein n=1 Tax=Cephalotrichum gorgonifer TaxID=2041049 RepID=A0AAE8N0B0_9PEZI|nr:related to small s protein [Cephalotrichum gorgonifer]